MKDILT